MAGESEYYNPIIEAMVHTARLSQEHAKNVEAAKQHTETMRLRERAQNLEDARKDREMKLKEQEADRALELHKADMENKTKKAIADYEEKQIKARKDVAAGMASGIGREAYQNPGTGVNTATLPGVPYNPGIQPNLPDPERTPYDMVRVGDQNIPASAFPTPESEAERQGKLAYIKAEATARGRLPSQQELAAQQIEGRQGIAETTTGARSADVIKQLASRERIAKLQSDTQKAVANIHASMGGDLSGFDINHVSNAVNDLYITGTDNITSVPSKLRMGVKASVPPDWTLIDKNDKPLLNAASSISKIIEYSKELAPYSGINENLGKTILGEARWGEIGAMRNEVEGLSGRLAKAFSDEKGVLTNPDIKRALGLVYSPYVGKEGNLANLEKLQGVYKEIMKPVLTKYAPAQRNAILGKRGIDPGTVWDEPVDNTSSSGGTKPAVNKGTVVPGVKSKKDPLNLFPEVK